MEGTFNIMPIDTVTVASREVAKMPVETGVTRTELAVTNISGDNEELMFKGIDFGTTGLYKVRIHGKLDAPEVGATRQITIGQYRSDGTGIRLADCSFEKLDGSGYVTQEFLLTNSIRGINDIYLTFMPGSVFNLDWIEFVALDAVVSFDATSLEAASGKKLTVTASIPESMKVPGKTINMFVVLYDKDKKLFSVDSFEDVNNGSYSVNIPEDTSGMVLKTFLWDDEFIPVMSPTVLN